MSSYVETHITNPSDYIVNVMTNDKNGLLTSVQYLLLLTEDNTLNMWTSTNQELMSNQVSNPIVQWVPDSSRNANGYYKASDTNNPDQVALANGLNAVMDASYDGNHNAKHNSDGSGAMANFIKSFLTSTSGTNYLNDMSEAFGATITSVVQASWDTGKDSISSAQMSAVSSYTQLISANAQKDEQIGGTMSKTESSQIQIVTNNPENLNQIATAVFGITDSLNNLLQQAYS